MTDDQKRFDPRFDPAFQRGFDGPVETVSAAPAVSRLVPPAPESPVERAAVATPVAPADSEPPHRTTNPFLIALGVVAVVLTGLGLYLFQAGRAGFLAAQNSTEYFSFQTVVFAAPLCVALGLATGIGVLFVYAVRFRR